MPLICTFQRQDKPGARCPRCGWAKQVSDTLCLLCRSEDKLRAENHPILKGQDHRDQFENCYSPNAGGFQLYSVDPPWTRKRTPPGLKRS